MNLAKRCRKGIDIALLLVLLCQETIGATSFKYNNGEKGQETIVAVAGISPALIDTAMSLFENSGQNPPWPFPNNLMFGGERDKVFPFPMMDAPKPFKPFLPPPMVAPAAASQQQPSVEEKDQPVNAVPLTSLTPQQPTEQVAPPPELPVEEKPAVAVVSLQQESDAISLLENEHSVDSTQNIVSDTSSFVPPPPMESVHVPEVEILSSSTSDEVKLETYSAPLSPSVLAAPQTTTTSSGPGLSQSSQGHNTGGSQILSMNLIANQGSFASTNNVNMQVSSNGASDSKNYFVGGSKGDLDLSHHPHGQSQGGVVKYVIQFNSRDNIIEPGN